MPHRLCLTITFLDPRFHGRRNGGEPEWPPSPLRLYQAIVAAAAAPTGRIGQLDAALRWLEKLPPPTILAPVARTGEPYRLSVPNNAMDLVAKAWAKGNYDGSGDANPATHRTMKMVRPTHLMGGDQIRYLWKLPDPMSRDDKEHAEFIRLAVRSVVALGWGVDLVVGNGELLPNDLLENQSELTLERWQPGMSHAGVSLRTPTTGTLDALIRRHESFQNRITDAGFIPVPPLGTFSIVGYRRATDPLSRPYAAFALRRLDDPSRWYALRQERAICVAGMLRHVAWEAAKADLGEWRDEKWSEQFVAGHGPRDRKESFPRFSYLPLPTLGSRHADGMIRRVLMAEPFGGDGASVRWAQLRLGGAVLREEGTGRDLALLQPLSESDGVLGCYTRPARIWQSITPVILPGFDDRKPARRERMLRQCFKDAGVDLSAVESFEARSASFIPASIGMQGYKRPKYLVGLPAVHVRLVFRQVFAGPIAIGAGRHCGLGLFAAAES